MNRFKSILCASLLTLAMSSATFAGNIYSVKGTIYCEPEITTVSGTIYSITGNIYSFLGPLLIP
jgi:hypothetical protein